MALGAPCLHNVLYQLLVGPIPGGPRAVGQHLPVGWPPALWAPSHRLLGVSPTQLGEPRPLNVLLDGLADRGACEGSRKLPLTGRPQQPCGKGPGHPTWAGTPRGPSPPFPALPPTAHPTEPASAHLHCSIRNSATENAQDEAEGRSHPDAPALHTWRVAASTDGRWGPLSRGIHGAWRPGGGCTVSLRLKTCCPLHTPSRDQTEKLPLLEG